MKLTLKGLIVPIVALGVGLFVGGALGQRQGLAMGLGFLESEQAFALSMHVEAASCVRIGDADCALKALDTMIDLTAVSAHTRPELKQLQWPMSQAKVYRSVVPAQGPTAPQVEAAVAAVPDAPAASSGLRRLVSQAGK